MKKKNIQSISDSFTPHINKYWNQLITGGGFIKKDKSIIKIGFESATSEMYTDAQLDDYTMFGRSKYPWKPPLRMTIKAKFSFSDNNQNKNNAAQGTAGFGFWNNPFSVTGALYSLPEAIWFFYASSKSNMKLSKDRKGYGWKAQIVHSIKFTNILNAIPTALAIGHARLTNNNKLATKWIEKFSGVDEAELMTNMDEWHIYKLEWEKDKATFYIDDNVVMISNKPPTQPLGFVIWVDNQYAIITPAGQIHFDTTESKSLLLNIASIKIESLKI